MIPDNETFDYIAHVTRQVYENRIDRLETVVGELIKREEDMFGKLLKIGENQQFTINEIIRHMCPEFTGSEPDVALKDYMKRYGTESSEDYK